MELYRSFVPEFVRRVVCRELSFEINKEYRNAAVPIQFQRLIRLLFLPSFDN